MSKSYEVYAYKQGNWNIDSVYDDKQQAMFEARQLLESRHLSGVQVIEENFDESSGETFSKIIFQRTKGSDEPRKRPKLAAKRPPKKTPDGSPNFKAKKKKDDGFVRYIVLLVVTVGGLGLGLIALLFFVMQSLD